MCYLNFDTILKLQTTDELIVIRFLGTGAHTLGQLYSVEHVSNFCNALRISVGLLCDIGSKDYQQIFPIQLNL